MIDAVNIELPGIIAVERVLDGDAVAHFPAETFGRASAHDGPLAILKKSVPLVVGNQQLGIYLALVFRVDGELREKVLLVLINPAEPVVMGHALHAGNAQDLVTIGEGYGLNYGNAIDGHQPVGAGDGAAAAEGILHHGKKGEEKQRHGE